MSDTDLEQLVRAAAAGDRAAFGELVRRFQDMAVAIGYGFLGDRELARDAAQDAFVDAYLHLGQLSEPRAFAGWFKRVLHKHCDRRVRRLRPDPASLERHGAALQSTSDPERALLAGEQVSWLQTAIEGLPEHERLAVALHYLAGLPLHAVGSLLEVEPNAIKQRLHSARKRLRKRSEHAMQRDFERIRPSRNAAFSDQIALFLAVRAGDETAVRALV